MHDITIRLTDQQYQRFRAAYQALYELDEPPTDEQLAGQMIREAKAICYAVENPHNANQEWTFGHVTMPAGERIVSAFEFYRRFPQATRNQLRALRRQNADIDDFLDTLDKAVASGTRVHENDPDVRAALAAFRAGGLIPAEFDPFEEPNEDPEPESPQRE